MPKQLVKARNSAGVANEYKVTMHGVMRLRSETGPGTVDKTYEHTFTVNDELKKKGLKYVFKFEYAPRFFPQLYPGFEELLEYHVKKVTCDANPEAVASDPNLLDRAGLVEFIEDYGLDVEEELYVDDDQIRDAIRKNIEDEDTFKRNQTIRRMKLGDKVSNLHELDALNKIETEKEVQAAITAEKAEAELQARIDAAVEERLAAAKQKEEDDKKAAETAANLAELDKKAAAELDKKKDVKTTSKADNV